MKVRTFAYGGLQPANPRDGALARNELERAARYHNDLVRLGEWRNNMNYFARHDDRVRPDGRDAVSAEYSLKSRALRATCGLGPGTYLLVEADARAALKFRPGSRPRMKKPDGTGRIGAGIGTNHSSKPRTDLLGSGKCGLVLTAADALRRATLGIRVGVASDGEWVTIPLVLHRPLPPGRVQQAWIQVERIGERLVWGARFVVSEDEAPSAPVGVGTCAVNFGWRSVRNGVRVAYAVGDDGSEIECVVPREILGAMRHSEKLRSIADAEAAAYLGDARRRSRSRRVGIAAGDPHGPTRKGPWENLTHWAKQDRHLYQWERDEYAKAIRARRAVTLEFCQRLVARYEMIRVEKFSLPDVIRADAPTEIPEAKHVRFLAAPGEVRATLIRLAGDARVDIVRAKALTCTCHACGGKCEWDQARELDHVCEHCGARWDQDANNARNQHASEAAE